MLLDSYLLLHKCPSLIAAVYSGGDVVGSRNFGIILIRVGFPRQSYKSVVKNYGHLFCLIPWTSDGGL